MITKSRAILLAVGMLTLTLAGCVSTGTGEHAGYVTNVERTGVVWQTWTVHFKTDLESTQEDTYCVPPDGSEEMRNLINQLRAASNQNDRVILEYRSQATAGPWSCGGTFDPWTYDAWIITGVRQAEGQ